MKLKYKKRNSQRMQSAINRVLTSVYSVLCVSYIGRYRIVYEPYSSRNLGVSIIMLAYGADKYDVLNKLCCPYKRGIMSFVRCDIRHRSRLLDLLLLLLLLTYLWLMSQPIIYAVAETAFQMNTIHL